MKQKQKGCSFTAASFAKLKKRIMTRFRKIGQLVYLTGVNFLENNLFESANSCAFGFIFSFIPLTLIILTVIVGLLKSNPSVLQFFMDYINRFNEVVDISSIVNQVLGIKSISFLEIILAFWVIWMARKLFSSVLGSINKIFKNMARRKTLINQLFSFLVEFLLIVLIIAVMLFVFVLNRIIELPAFRDAMDDLPVNLLDRLSSNASLIIYLIIFVFTVVLYRMGSAAKPKMGLCFFYALCSTVCFYFTAKLIHVFFNPSNYNLIYGAISSLLILMMQVWFFFNIFLFFAQMLFSTEYLDMLSFALLYLLPNVEDSSKWAVFKRNLFRKPAVIQTKYPVKKFKIGEKIYSKGDVADCVYYICHGTVCRISADDSVTLLKEGSFFGEMHCILNQNRTNTTVAQSDCEITIIGSHDFLELLQKNAKASSKAISKVSSYTEELYHVEQQKKISLLEKFNLDKFTKNSN